MLTAGKRALHRAVLRNAELPREFRVQRNLRASGVDEKSHFAAAIHTHADQGQRVCAQEFETRHLPFAEHLVGRLPLEASKFRDVQSRILRDDQSIRAHVDAV